MLLWIWSLRWAPSEGIGIISLGIFFFILSKVAILPKILNTLLLVLASGFSFLLHLWNHCFWRHSNKFQDLNFLSSRTLKIHKGHKELKSRMLMHTHTCTHTREHARFRIYWLNLFPTLIDLLSIIMWFLSFINVTNYSDWFSNVKPNFSSWNKNPNSVKRIHLLFWNSGLIFWS